MQTNRDFRLYYKKEASNIYIYLKKKKGSNLIWIFSRLKPVYFNKYIEHSIVYKFESITPIYELKNH